MISLLEYFNRTMYLTRVNDIRKKFYTNFSDTTKVWKL